MKIGIIVALLLLLAVPVWAVTYTWVDDQGTVNFSEDYGSIPPKYRKKAKVLGAEEEAAPAGNKEIPEETKPAPRAKEAAPAKEQPAAEKKVTKKTYGDKSAEEWKTAFGKLNADIKAAEDQLDELRGRLSDTSKMTRSDYLSIQRTIRVVEDRIVALRKKRDALTDEANRAEVPAELRGQ